eukprot:scaffold58267_cov90-Phaeocystis_antarctica.AAC.2
MVISAPCALYHSAFQSFALGAPFFFVFGVLFCPHDHTTGKTRGHQVPKRPNTPYKTKHYKGWDGLGPQIEFGPARRPRGQHVRAHDFAQSLRATRASTTTAPRTRAKRIDLILSYLILSIVRGSWRVVFIKRLDGRDEHTCVRPAV